MQDGTYYAASAGPAPARPALPGMLEVDTCIVGGGSFSRIYQNGDFEQFAQSASGSGSGGYIGYDTVNGGAIMSLCAFGLYTSALSGNSVEPTVIRKFEKLCGIQRQFDTLVLVMGASSESGTMSTTGSSWPFELAPLPEVVVAGRAGGDVAGRVGAVVRAVGAGGIPRRAPGPLFAGPCTTTPSANSCSSRKSSM